MFLWWVGSRPTAPTPNLGDQDFLSGLSPLAFSVPTPLLQGNKICNPRQGPLQGAISRSQPTPGFFSRLLLLPLLLSQPGLGPAMAELFELCWWSNIYFDHTQQDANNKDYQANLTFMYLVLFPSMQTQMLLQRPDLLYKQPLSDSVLSLKCHLCSNKKY
jgi:hypothetical protein